MAREIDGVDTPAVRLRARVRDSDASTRKPVEAALQAFERMCSVQVPRCIFSPWVCNLLTATRPPGLRQTPNKVFRDGAVVEFPSSSFSNECFGKGECQVSIFDLMSSCQSKINGIEFGSPLDHVEG